LLRGQPLTSDGRQPELEEEKETSLFCSTTANPQPRQAAAPFLSTQPQSGETEPAPPVASTTCTTRTTRFPSPPSPLAALRGRKNRDSNGWLAAKHKQVAFSGRRISSVSRIIRVLQWVAAIHASFNAMSGPERRFPASDWFSSSPMTSAQQWGQALLGRECNLDRPCPCFLQPARRTGSLEKKTPPRLPSEPGLRRHAAAKSMSAFLYGRRRRETPWKSHGSFAQNWNAPPAVHRHPGSETRY